MLRTARTENGWVKGIEAADIHIKMNVALIKVRRTGFPYFRVRIYSFQVNYPLS